MTRSLLFAAALAATLAPVAAPGASAVEASNGLTNGPNGRRPNGIGMTAADPRSTPGGPSRAIGNPRSTFYNSGRQALQRRKHP